ncbi:hypothetical protein ACIBKX_14130 [Streptomyces sp. NPDC050658]|uniref:hypothetical protein n=1 Tax=unclassified Streptomyces TaxID=2593676 RepID=UPI00341F7D48
MTGPRDESRVRHLLAAAGLPAERADDGEVAGFVTAYVVQRPAVDALFEVSAARYARPVLGMEATVRRDEGGEPA